jgi:hypothetical protein
VVVEQVAAIDRLDDFFEPIDADDLSRATTLLKRAGIDAKTVAIVRASGRTSGCRRRRASVWG